VKSRYVLWPVLVFSAVSIASACSSSSSTGDGGVGATGGANGNGEGGGGNVNVGATSSNGATDAGGMSTTEGGNATGGVTGGGEQAGGASGTSATGGAGADLCEGLDLTCDDDNNPCTEDECNPATGKCGIPRSETTCDDGLYCNGADTCEDGACAVHDGNPCSGTCNEPGKYCQCATKDDCPADEPGEFSACNWANECVEGSTRSRPVTKYSCNNVGKCVTASAIDTEACTRETDAIACTDDGNRCNGLEKCKAGSCVPQGIDPCKGNAANPYCYQSGDPVCRVCTSTGFNGKPNVGCSGTEYCCSGVCKASSCLVIGTIQTTIIQTVIIQTQ
jgi:hypothetical protein